MSRTLTPFAIACLVLVALFPPIPALTPAAQACRIIEPRPIMPPHPWPPQPPMPRPEPRAITTRAHSAEITVKDQVAEVHVNATFYNPNPFRMEGTYWFPLPADAAIKDFQMIVNGTLVKAELVDAGKAREIYESIVRRQRDPALLEWIGTQILQCRIFPIEPNSEVKISLSYTQVLPQDSGLVRLTYPLRSAKPNAGTIGQLTVHVKIQTTQPLKTVYSPTQTFEVKQPTDKTAQLTYEGQNVDPARDVEILFSRSNSEVGLTAISHKPAADDGYFLITLAPGLASEDAKPIKKDVIFVCDTSGSMQADGKIDQAKKALSFCVNALHQGDRFNIIAFSTEVRTFKPGLVERDADSVKAAGEFISKLEALGGTAINDALAAALQSAKTAENVPMIIFLTDGNPTIGEQNPDTILKNIRDANASKCRLFVFGVGYDVNTRLLDLLADENHGARDYVKPNEDLEVKLSALYTKVADPALSDVALDFGGADVADIYPKRLPDLFHGSQITLLGRFKKPGDYVLTLSGKIGGEKKNLTYSVTFADTKSDDYIPRMWALRKVAFLLDEIRLHGQNKEVVDEITRLGKLYGILTPYTSFLIVEEGAPPVEPQFRRELMRAAEDGRGRFDQAAQRPGASVGRNAVHDSARLADAKAGAIAPPAASAGGFGLHAQGQSDRDEAEFKKDLEKAAAQVIRHIDGKTFYVKADGFWLDSTVDNPADPKIKDIKLWSDEFFALVKAHPELGKALTQTQRLIIRLGSDIYRIQ